MAHTTAEWIPAVAKMRKLVGVYLAVKPPLSAHQQASLATDLKTLDTDLAGLAASLQAAVVPAGGDPMLIPTDAGFGGKLYSKAALLDANSIATVNAGNPPIAVAAAYSGQAAAEGYSGVVAAGTGGDGWLFTVFKDGAVVGTEAGDNNTDTSALAARFGVSAA